MAFSSICSTKNMKNLVKHEEKLNQEITDSFKYTLIKKFLDLIEYQSTLFTPEEIESYYNEYSSKILNRVLERKVMRDNCQQGSVYDGGGGGSSVLNENRGFDNDIRRHVPMPTGIRKAVTVSEHAKLGPPIIEEELNETSRIRNTRNKIQQTAHTRDFNRKRNPDKHDDNEKQREHDHVFKLQVANKKSRAVRKETGLVDYSTNSLAFVSSTPIIPQESTRKTVNKQFKKPGLVNEIRPKRKRQEQHYRGTEEVSDECNDSDINDLCIF